MKGMGIEETLASNGMTVGHEYRFSDTRWDYYQLVLAGEGLTYEMYGTKALAKLPKGSDPSALPTPLSNGVIVEAIQRWIGFHNRQTGITGDTIGKTIGTQPTIIPEWLELRYLTSYRYGKRQAVIVLTGPDGTPIPSVSGGWLHIKAEGPYVIRLAIEEYLDIDNIQGDIVVGLDADHKREYPREVYRYLSALIGALEIEVNPISDMEGELISLANDYGLRGGYEVLEDNATEHPSNTLRGSIVCLTERTALEVKELLLGMGVDVKRVVCRDTLKGEEPLGCIWAYVCPNPKVIEEHALNRAEEQEMDNQVTEGALRMPLHLWLQVVDGDGLEPPSGVGSEVALPQATVEKEYPLGVEAMGAAPMPMVPLPLESKSNVKTKTN
jgi:hypothetical protein